MNGTLTPHRLLGEMAYLLRRLLEDDHDDPAREYIREAARMTLAAYADYVAPALRREKA